MSSAILYVSAAPQLLNVAVGIEQRLYGSAVNNMLYVSLPAYSYRHIQGYHPADS